MGQYGMSKARKPSAIYSLDIRIAAWEDAGRMCHYCDRPVPRPGTKGGYGTHIDHVVPVAKGGSHDMENLVVSCKRCNREKGSKSYRDYLEWRLALSKQQAKRIQELLGKMHGRADTPDDS